jgi:Uma2 family endonuclease
MTMLRQMEPKIVEYPDSDGAPMGETGFHVALMVYVIGMLRAFFHHRSDAYVGGNMFLYYEKGDPHQCVAPDTFVAFGVSPHERRSWFVWQEGKAPDVVFEFTSRTTRAVDQGSKRGLYAYLGVKEYFLFDPLGEYLRPNLQGFRLVDGAYQDIPMVDEQLHSEQLGLRLKAHGAQLDLYEAQTNRRLLPPPEMTDALAQIIGALAKMTDALTDAESEISRLRAEVERLKKNA